MMHLLAFAIAAAPFVGGPIAPEPPATDARGPAYLLIAGTLTCDAFDAMMERFVRRPEVHEFEASRCVNDEIEMVVEFKFESRAERSAWISRPEIHALLKPLYHILRDSKVQFVDRPRDPRLFLSPKTRRGASPEASGECHSSGTDAAETTSRTQTIKMYCVRPSGEVVNPKPRTHTHACAASASHCD